VSYRTSATGTTSLSGSTAIVIVTGQLSRHLVSLFPGDWTYAVNSSGTFTFHRVDAGGDTVLSPTVTLPVVTLDDSLLGNTVLIDVGGGHFQRSLVTGDGTSFSPGDGRPAIGSTARAIDMANVVGYVGVPPTNPQSPASVAYAADKIALAGITASGLPQFTGTYAGTFYGSAALTTYGSITPGNSCLVETAAGGPWIVTSA
jgi:hypothetical protein